MNAGSFVDVHKLAAMPGYGAAAEIIRKEIDPHWGRVGPEGLIRFTVIVQMEKIERDEAQYTYFAKDEDDAKEIARESFDDEFSCTDWEFENAFIKK